jgi:hypothetical protein
LRADLRLAQPAMDPLALLARIYKYIDKRPVL